ncbi:MAG: L,D-transpeptidase family protein, partial [Alphaproteobacteria bacterium]|nr:L,D-transpeptidase family protein [Alphaproteobacteria bacterium]
MLYAIERAIAKYERIVANGGWPEMPGKRMIRVGDNDDRVPAMRRILRVTGDYRKQAGYFSSQIYDAGLAEGVKRFQTRHGLRATGRVDRPTIASLNVPAKKRLQQLRQNYDRIAELLRMAPADDRYVLVNAAAFQLEAVDRHQVELRHRVIVGRPGRDTPQLRAMIKAVNFFPYWKVPESVAVQDIIPRLQKEPDFLFKEGIRVVEGDFNGPEINPTQINWNIADAKRIRFKQDPGPKNALGLVRIDMQNPEGVYMHDTPLKNLFAQNSRAFSAGCV